MELIRLNKYLKDLDVCSRRKADEFIADGLVKVNGEIVSELGCKINPQVDKVELLPQIAEARQQFRYILLNKPRGYVCSRSRQEGKLVFDLLPGIKDLAYAGRLDKDSHGLILLSTDGKFVYRCAGAEFIKEKEYIVRVNKVLTPEFIVVQGNGSIILDGKKVRPAKIEQLGSHSYKIILTEGLNRQIRRMAEACSFQVLDLQRVRIGQLKDPKLKLGSWRELTKAEVQLIMVNDDANPANGN